MLNQITSFETVTRTICINIYAVCQLTSSVNKNIFI